MKPIKLNEKKIIKLYESGQSTHQIGEMFGVSWNTINRRLQKNNTVLRKGNKKYTCKYDYFDKIDTEEKAYWLGFIFGDGGVYKNRFKLELSNIDEAHLYKFNNSISSNYLIKHYKKSSFITITSKDMLKTFIKYGIVYRKTYETNKLPLELIPDDLQRHFVRGLIDADGHTSAVKRKNKDKLQINFGFTTYHIEIIIQLKKWFNKHNIKGGWITQRKRITGNSAILQFGGAYSFQQLIYLLYNNSTISLERKFTKNKELIKYLENYQPLHSHKNCQFYKEMNPF